MTNRAPIETKNIDQYGNPAIPWSRASELLEKSTSGAEAQYYLGTVRPDGRPHSAGIGALWYDGDVYIVSGPETRKSRNLAANPACTISVQLKGLDLIMEGEAQRVIDTPTLERIAQLYSEQGWPAEVQGDLFTAPFFAPSGGPPPWQLFRITIDTAFGVATAEPNGATRWRFR